MAIGPHSFAFRRLLPALRQALGLLLASVLTTAWVYLGLVYAPGGEALPGFGAWLSRALLGELGESSVLRLGEPVATLLRGSLWESLWLVGLALWLALLFSAPLAWLWSQAKHPKIAALTQIGVYAVSASPSFLLAYWLIMGVNQTVHHGILEGFWEAPAWFPVPLETGVFRYGLAALALGVGSGVWMDLARGLAAELRRLMNADFILFARAGGERLLPHLWPNLIAPVSALLLGRLLAIFGGAVVVEVIFNLPGLGRLTWDAALARDAPLLLGASLVWALIYAAIRFSLSWVDRRLIDEEAA